ncbi:phosphoribosylformylglycinamidine synthase subunit PurL [Nakamurella aerolata]|uniref:Phosphoribosylformylglycinamidine synthase subunit PurL n=1 Tax=Nakamurella aerolata TaxID=1656892 RepID=A0A849AFE6_9ACTN|nr:phosphoribosylformylglycinamidine synthase subunit PurL [Nakamurella aerolata]NNG35562.1 phosphoribosylformylglycinamidine synthase subunit PurL [Nakamurella aerolata]
MTTVDPAMGAVADGAAPQGAAAAGVTDPVVSEDTVEQAAASPEQPQPHRELGLKDDEYQRIRDILGRRPTDAELAMYSVMWSEHCSYKSSKVHLKYFGETTTDEMRSAMLAGIGENAGVVDIGDGWAATFKVESHNHPSYVEPYSGAATGVGGIVRDILAMGARPVAVTDQLRFGPADAPDSQRVVPGIVAGVAGYGDCLGLPNIGGEVFFDGSFAGNPLVNAGCIGVLRADDMYTAHASGVGNKVILYGSATGLDGIGGVSVLASDTFGGDESSSAGRKKLPSVQVGDPFAEKVLIECTLEVFAADLVVGIQDLGGAGLSCATSELASAGTGGMHIDLDQVPRRADNMTAAEVLSSESQERMCAVVTPDKVQAFLDVCAKWEVPAAVIGEVTDTGRLVITHQGETVVDVPPRTVAHDGPVYQRPVQRPDQQDALQANTSASLPRPAHDELMPLLVRMAGSPNLCSRSWVTDQYDRYVRGNTVLAQPADAGVVRVADDSVRGVAMATDCNSRYTALDPYRGAQLALAEAYRNVAVSGAKPLAVTDCLNFGSPEDPAVMWQFQQAVRGLADGCRELGVPVTGGNVSFYNQTGSTAILPSPVIGVLGVVDDVRNRIPLGRNSSGDVVLLLGDTRDELDGSEWAAVEHRHLGGQPPVVDLAAERRLAELLQAVASDRLVSGAHDLSEGGLAQGLAELAVHCAEPDAGLRVSLPTTGPDGDLDAFTAMFSESSARALLTVPAQLVDQVLARCTAAGVPVQRLGEITADGALTIDGVGTVPVPQLRQVWSRTLPELFG